MIANEGVFDEDLIFDCIDDICKKFDIAHPVVLDKHKNDMNDFFMMRFFPDDFIEKVDFDKFEIEVYVEKKK